MRLWLAIATFLLVGYTINSALTVTGVQGQSTATPATLAAGATTFAATATVMTVACDTGGNTIATITGGVAGQVLYIIAVDGLCTFSDNNTTSAADTLDISGSATLTARDVLTLVHDGTKWYRVQVSTN